MSKNDFDSSYQPHDPIATDLYTDLVFDEYSRIEVFATDLLKTKSNTQTINNVEITFKLTNSKLLTNYRLSNGYQDSTEHKYKAMTNNNPALQELVLAIAEAETNAKMFANTDELRIYEYPAIGFYVQQEDANTLKFKTREKVRNLLLRFK